MSERELLGDAAHHLGALEHGHDVADGDEIFHLEGRQRCRHVVEPVAVPLERLEGLVRPAEQDGDGLERMLLVADVDRDHLLVLGDRDDDDVDGAGHPLGGAVTGAGLGRRHVRIGDEVDVGPGDAGGIGGEDDGPVHLGQLRQALRAEGGVEEKAAGADVEHVGSVADHHERAHLRLQDPVEAFPQRSARRHERERRQHLGRVLRRHCGRD